MTRPLVLPKASRLTSADWSSYFDDDGDLRFDDIDIPLVDFTDVEDAEGVWMTDQWAEARDTFRFLARSAPETVADAIRGTEAGPALLRAVGFTPIPTAAPPAIQFDPASLDIDLLQNATHAVRDGCSAFLRAVRDSSALVNAVPQLFRALETAPEGSLGRGRSKLSRASTQQPRSAFEAEKGRRAVLCERVRDRQQTQIVAKRTSTWRVEVQVSICTFHLQGFGPPH